MTALPDLCPRVLPCAHCGAPVEVSGEVGEAYCCAGCETAAAIIRGAGLDVAYRSRREAYAPRPSRQPPQGWSQIETRSGPNGTCEADLRIDGLSCAACVWVTEHVLSQTEGVVEAHVSYASGRALLRWDPAMVSLDDALQRVASLGYTPRATHAAPERDRALLTALGIAVFSAMNVMMLSLSIYLGWWGGMSPAHAALLRWCNLVLATPVALWCARPFYRAALSGLRSGILHMDLPVSIGVIVLYVHGLAATFSGTDGYLDSMTMLVALLLGGRVLEQGGRRRAAEAAAALASWTPQLARRLRDGLIEEVAPSELTPGDRLVVAAGEAFAADGTLASGSGDVQMSLLTGESEPVHLSAGDRVVAGALLSSGSVEVIVEAVGEETTLAAMVRRLESAISQPLAPRRTDAVAPWFVGATLTAAAATLSVVGWSQGLEEALARTVAVLVVACPCALSLAWPLATSAGMGAAARRGLVLRSGEVLETLAGIDTVALDKTGTITGGRPEVVRADDATLRVAAGLERASSHPVARAILDEAARRGVALPPVTDAREQIGEGVEGTIDGRRWRIRSGGPGRLALEADDGTVAGEIELRDVVRPDAARAVARLRASGLRVVLLTGDHPDVAQRIAAEVGIDEVIAGSRPEDKADWVVARQAEGCSVLFVGDGLNDGPALAEAAVGVAMGAGAASSVQVADAVVASDRLGPLLAGLSAARASKRATQRGLRRAIVYNIVAVIGAMLGWINPLVAAILMPLSSGAVIAGALAVERRVSREERS
ncbi:MAG: Cu2+-exporting ATPase [Myxococcota bacterium]